MIKIYDQTTYLDIEDNADLETTLEVMEELDEIYKKRSENNELNITINKRTLYYSTLYVLNDLTSLDAISVITDSLRFWEKFSVEEQEKLFNEISKKVNDNLIVDKTITYWISKQTNSIF